MQRTYGMFSIGVGLLVASGVIYGFDPLLASSLVVLLFGWAVRMIRSRQPFRHGKLNVSLDVSIASPLLADQLAVDQRLLAPFQDDIDAVAHLVSRGVVTEGLGNRMARHVLRDAQEHIHDSRRRPHRRSR